MEPFKSLKQHYGGQGGGLRFVSPVFCQKSDYCSPQRLSDLTPCEFVLLPKFYSVLKGRYFDTTDDNYKLVKGIAGHLQDC